MKRNDYPLIISLVVILLILIFSFICIEQIALWAYPKDNARNGKVLQLILNVLGGTAVLYGLYVAFRRARAMERGVEIQGEALEKQSEQIELTRKSQIDERFKNAVEHLGSDKEPIILGGIAELHQIALENHEMYAEVVFNILCSYIRSTSNMKKEPKDINRTINQTIINYLFQNHEVDNYPYSNLSPDLSYSNLNGTNLENVNISNANLSFCFLPSINASTFTKSNFSSSNFLSVDLSNIKFYECEFFETYFNISYFQNIEFINIKCSTSLFSPIILNSEFKNVEFRGIELYNSNFFACYFEECTFSRANILKSFFIGSGFKNVKFDTNLFGSLILERQAFQMLSSLIP
ncbi:pentapeptide repeat-containing protein [Rapidithrix thailandica]|uniref:Pentapeptide repeat-containing protein n=1 Tax=Rapidithrix thailandica TaxID=413964 RepID=A0AAW9S9Y6_9BACT